MPDRLTQMFRRTRLFRCISMMVLLAAILAGCSKNGTGPAEPTVYLRGDIITVEDGLGYTLSQLLELAAQWGTTLPDSQAYGVDTWSITYMSTDAEGNPQIVSGALIVPRSTGPLSLLSIQHGTIANRALVASTPPVPLSSTEGNIGLVMASFGYLVMVPDYPGFGISGIPHPYMHADSNVPSVVDGLRTARNWAGDNDVSLDGRVFLTGYSEGGYLTLAAQKEIEREYSTEFDLAAVAPMAGPYDLYGRMFSVFTAADYSTPASLAYIMTACDDIYGWDRLDEFINAPWAAQLPGLFDGSRTWGDLENTLPATFDGLMRAEFVADVLSGNEIEFIAALQENSLLDWVPAAPLHLIHGTADDIVFFQSTLDAESAFTALGATDILVTAIPGADHRTAGLPAILTVMEWFSGIRTETDTTYSYRMN